MGEATDPIRRDIDRERHELADNLEGIEAKVQQTTNQVYDKVDNVQHQVQDKVEEVQEKFREATDWRGQFDKRPMLGLAVAFGSGVLLASVLGGGDREGDRGSYRGGPFGYQPQFQSYGSSSGGMNVGKQHVSSTFDNVKSALMGVAAAQLKNVLDDALPGFSDEYRQVEEEEKSSSSRLNYSGSPQSATAQSSAQQTASGERRQSI